MQISNFLIIGVIVTLVIACIYFICKSMEKDSKLQESTISPLPQNNANTNSIINPQLHIEDPDIVKLRDFVMANFDHSCIHGIRHWDRVYNYGMQLLTPEVNKKVVQAFAYLHDTCREADGYDEEHGPRAAEMIGNLRTTILAFLSDEEFALLHDACMYHTTVERTSNPTINACFDADRLDLWRVGIVPFPERMASPLGAEIARNTDYASIAHEVYWVM